ncbi:TonB-linked SusC/RagA family outer membrane protein [Lewinella marina]|uniref:SusC/RagA family TonB-linked outer membrane protein n=1 Tax=Neolewinella marina TaxID=438751 RepID=A0A2G0CGZ4_9BACT|nr:SusC/RagA family TonB-linked outer membrane protein [Neolewinella marina]NJB86273.1 TonB-linked SusC/RagA family outer membrane protein [Neolewinella marina]PHK99255.1 SusC/RagA family TonB-linked outer membrane protein [Neolewinella marina]
MLRNQLPLAGSLLLALFLPCLLFAQYPVNGTVTDRDGEPLIGVSILVVGTTTGTITDFDGQFQLDIPTDPAELRLTYTGFAPQVIEVSRGIGPIEVVMQEDIANLEQVVVTGLASTIKRSNLANAVATVSGDELSGVTSQQTVDGALYGKLTGVNITQTSGAPGGGYAVRLRGVSSLSGNNQPLFIVDGVYISNVEIPNGSRNASGANSASEESASNRIADINPDDIESIEVLKGASAAAIYGTRANAGVIIITTKKGVSGETRVSFNQDLGFNTIIRKVGRRSYNADQIEEAYGASARAEFEAAQSRGEIFDYEDIIYGEQGFITDSRLRVSGGDDKTNFFVSSSWRDEAGIIKNTGYERFTARLNLSHKINDRLRIQSNTNYIRSSASRSFSGNENEGGLSYGYTLAFTRDYVNLFPDENGNYPDNPNFSGNPLQTRDQTRNEEYVDRVLEGININLNLLQTNQHSLNVVLNGGLDFILNKTFVYVPENFQSQRGRQNGFIAEGKNDLFNYNYSAIAVHDYYTDGGINFTTQAGITYINQSADQLLSQTTQLIPLQTNLSRGAAQETDQTLLNVEEFGYVVQEEVNLNDRIIATAGIRFDKSSLNGDPNKLYAFPRASVAMNLHEFDFWTMGGGFVNQLKLRAAYGETGNSASFGRLFTSLTNTSIGGRAGFTVNGQQGNSALEPETSSEIEFGTDIGLADNKVNITATYYVRDVTNLLYDRSLPTSSGFSNEIRNDLDLRNRGFEFQLGLNPLRTPAVDYRTTFNFWLNRSEITRLGVVDGSEGKDIPSFVPTGVAFGLGLGTFYINEGSPITGLWENVNGVPTQTGNTEPDFQFGWNNNFTFFENLDVNFLFHWREGSELLNLTRLLTDLGKTTPREFDDLGGFIEDGSYFRLREAGVAYRFPLDNKFIKGLKVGLSGRNIFTITDYSSYDPETSVKGGGGLSTNIEVAPFPSSKQFYLQIGLDF